MNPRVVALPLAVVSLIAVFFSYSLWLKPGGDARRATPATAPASEPASTEPLPAPAGEPVLRLKGVSHGNVGHHSTALDFATLDELAVERLTVHEPFLKRDVTFTGVWMRDFISRAGVGDDARSLYFHALDDYHVELPIADVEADGFLAVRAGGKPIEIADGGPIRLVFGSDQGAGSITDNWIWSIDSIRAIR